MRIGIDLGGTKIEAIALDESGATLLRRRVPTPTGDYVGTLNAIANLVLSSETELCQKGSLGIATPADPTNSFSRKLNSLVDHYTGGHGMLFCLEDQKPQRPAPAAGQFEVAWVGGLVRASRGKRPSGRRAD